MRFLIVAILLNVLAVMPAAASDPDGPKPEIFIEEMHHDLGEVYEQEKYTHRFLVQNKGAADLKIESVRPSCGCTIAEFDDVISAGKSGYINLEITGSKVTGTFNKSASVTTNDPDHPVLSISLGGKILRYVDVDPARVYLRGMYEEPVSKDLLVVSHEKDRDFKVLGVTSTLDDKITYRVEPDAEPGRYRVKLFKNPRLPTMNEWGQLTIHTNSEHAPDKIVQVNVVTRGAIVVQPSTVNFGSVDAKALMGAQGVEKEITVFKLKGEFKITDIQFSDPAYEARVEPVADGKYKIKVGFHPGKDKQDRAYVDEMIINTDDPNEPAVRVRVVARTAGGA